MMKKWIPMIAAGLLQFNLCAADASMAKIAINLNGPGKPISSDLFGIFYEDINYAADGGLYAELIQNRSFEYNAMEQTTWNGLTSWSLEEREGGKGFLKLEDVEPICANNPHYLIVRVNNMDDGGGVGLINDGFDGIPVKAGETYDVSFFGRQLYMNSGYGAAIAIEGKPMPMVARLESQDGTLLGECEMKVEGWDWDRSAGSITATNSDDHARFVLLARSKGGIALDEISLFPRKTFCGRKNGLRSDIAQTIADMHPRFVRFPGGCVAHGDGLKNIYRWKDTIGPVERRRGQKNFWGYHQSVGLGYFEYFQFCEDIGAQPIPIVAAGVSCQFADQKRGKGQQCISMEAMPAYIQDILDLIEWANGPATSEWGEKRAAAGHPAPFGLKYIGVGNEDKITTEFKERFAMIQEAVQEKHPEIQIIGTVGPDPAGEDFDLGWDFARERKIQMIDEHYYRPPQWFLDNQNRYDSYDRTGPKVYAGEYASKGNKLFNALAEAAFMTGLERNGDLVLFASYAPLLAKRGHTNWRPDLIYFDNTQVMPSINYHVQQLFSANAGDMYFPAQIEADGAAGQLAVSTVRDSKTGDLILKVVNCNESSMELKINLDGVEGLGTKAVKTVLSGDANAENKIGSDHPLVPETSTITIGESFDCEAPAYSLTVIRITTESCDRMVDGRANDLSTN